MDLLEKSVLKKWDKAPPVVMRMLAADYGKPLGPNVIAKRAGLSRTTVQRISRYKSWAGIRIEVAEKFAHGCGFSLINFKEVLRRLRYLEARGLGSLKHLSVSKHAPLWRQGANGNTMKFLRKVIINE